MHLISSVTELKFSLHFVTMLRIIARSMERVVNGSYQYNFIIIWTDSQIKEFLLGNVPTLFELTGMLSLIPEAECLVMKLEFTA